MKSLFSRIMLSFVCWLLSCAALNAAEVSISGSGVAARLLTTHQAQIESKSGQQLIINSKNSMAGIEDLLAGDAQLAIVSGPGKSLYKYMGLTEETTDPLRSTLFYRDKLCFVVNPANPVSSLTKEQLVAIFTGKTTNWKEVGGPDAAIKVLTFGKGNGPRLVADAALWGDTPLVGLQEGPMISDATNVVSHSPEAISFTAYAEVTSAVKVIGSPAIALEMSFVTNGSPTVSQKAVIDAAKELLLKNGSQ